MTASEVEAIDLTDMEFERICMPYGEDCDRTAVWMLVKKCCGAEFPYCESHAERAKVQVERMLANWKRAHCNFCDSVSSPKRENYVWVRL